MCLDGGESTQSSTPSVSAHHERQRPDDVVLKIAAQGEPPVCALKSLAVASRDLLRRTAELPDTEDGLLLVLTEYRYAVFAFALVADKLAER
jgi:hypothetical protein